MTRSRLDVAAGGAVTRLVVVAAVALVGVVTFGVLLRLVSSDPVTPDGSDVVGSPAASSDRRVDVPAAAQRARVSSHVDGDTVRLVGAAGSTLLGSGGETAVRLLEIDTPEVAGSPAGEECYGAEADEALAGLLPVGASVWVMRDEDLFDRYDRMLLYVWTEDGTFVNLEMVRRGYARAVLFEPNDAYIALMRQAESQARTAEAGLWGACT